jgi:hypothetical protein
MEAMLMLPHQSFRLEEINLPLDLATSLAGKEMPVRVLPEEEAGTRRADPETESSVWIDPDGNYWNDCQPLRVLLTAPDGKLWRLPRTWLLSPDGEPSLDASLGSLAQKTVWFEELHLPSQWDLQDINLHSTEALSLAGRPAAIQVCATPGEPVKVFWRANSGVPWRIPHDWRRRRIKLPSFEVLTCQDIPSDVAQEYAAKIVSVNYHPGSLCCLPDSYRFRDREGNRWPVRMRDCVPVGYGDGEPSRVQ